MNVDNSGAIARYRLLSTIRQHAADRLDEVRETGKGRDQHLRYYLDVGIQLKPKLYGMTKADQLASISQVTLQLLREQMPSESFAKAWQAGRVMTVDQAVTYALERA